MKIRVLLLLIVLFALIPGETSAKTMRWRQERVNVYDYAGPEWDVQGAVDYFNTALPERAPTLVYIPMNGPCQRHGGAISVCALPTSQMWPGALGQSPRWGNAKRKAITRVEVSFAAVEHADGMILACHELFHAMGAVGHGSWTSVRPCPYDDAIMQDIYKREKRRHR